ncbi:MAG TPA: hypothetical protein VFU65_21780 [Actinocrinis sp.]|nr:hypothetical protein [Actinocrinis sp.]
MAFATQGSTHSGGFEARHGAQIAPTPAPRPVDALEFHAGPPGGDATRHLCAAAHLDRSYRNAAIGELVENEYRVPAASPGIDLARVLDECLTVRRDAAIAGGAIILIVVLGFLIAPLELLIALVVGVFIGVLLWLAARGAALLAAKSGDRGGASRAAVAGVLGIIVLGVGFAVLNHVFGLISGGFSSQSPSFSGSFNSYYPATSSEPGSGSTGHTIAVIFGSLFFLLSLTAVGAYMRYRQMQRFAALHQTRAEAESGAQFPGCASVFDRLRSRPAEAETLYSDFSPFTGAGVRFEDEGWSFPIELRPNHELRSRAAAPRPLDVPAIHRAMAAGLTGLSAGELYPGDMLHRLEVRDRAFRSAVRRDPPEEWYGRLSVQDEDSGAQTLDRQWADLLDLGSHERIRHYLEVRTRLWQDQLITTVFVRAYVQGGLLQVEGLAFVLPPIAERYRAVDEALPPQPWPDALGALRLALMYFGRDVLTSVVEPWGLLRSAQRRHSRQKWYSRMRASNRPVDYAPKLSLRQLGEERRYQQLFQEMDVKRFFTAVRERAFSAVLRELDRAGYDTSEFERVSQIINNNLNLGGGVQNVNSSVRGNQAGGHNTNVTQTVKT